MHVRPRAGRAGDAAVQRAGDVTRRSEFAGDVGSLRGTVKNLAAGVGTAVAGALVVGILSVNVAAQPGRQPAIPPELIQQVDLDRANFVSNERLQDVMAGTTATPEQVDEAVRINADARLRALKLSFLLLGGHRAAGDRSGWPVAGLRPRQRARREVTGILNARPQASARRARGSADGSLRQ